MDFPLYDTLALPWRPDLEVAGLWLTHAIRGTFGSLWSLSTPLDGMDPEGPEHPEWCFEHPDLAESICLWLDPDLASPNISCGYRGGVAGECQRFAALAAAQAFGGPSDWRGSWLDCPERPEVGPLAGKTAGFPGVAGWDKALIDAFGADMPREKALSAALPFCCFGTPIPERIAKALGTAGAAKAIAACLMRSNREAALGLALRRKLPEDKLGPLLGVALRALGQLADDPQRHFKLISDFEFVLLACADPAARPHGPGAPRI